MTDITLKNENGRLVGYDDDGDKVPVDFEAVGAARASIGPTGDQRQWGDEIQPVVVVGQSNATGRGDASESVDLPADVAQVYEDGDLSPLRDPVCSASDPDAAGSAWPAFARRYYELTQTPTAFAAAGLGGTSVVTAADRGAGNWSASGNLRAAAVDTWRDLRDELRDYGYLMNEPLFVWNQGAADAAAIRRRDIEPADYEAGLADLLSFFDEHLPVGWSFLLWEVGPGRERNDDAIRSVQRAQRNCCRETSYASYVSGIQQTFETLHYTQSQYDAMGRIGAENYLSGGVSPPHRPASACRSTPVSIADYDDGWTKIPLDAAIDDPHSQFDPADGTLVVEASGRYQVSGWTTVSAVPGETDCWAQIDAGNPENPITRSVNRSGGSGPLTVSTGPAERYFDAGDTLHLRVTQNSGRSIRADGGPDALQVTLVPVDTPSAGF